MNEGYVITPNAVYDFVLPNITGAEYKVFSVIVRKTLGWSKVWDRISLTQFQNQTGLSRPHVVKALMELEKTGLIVCKRIRDDGSVPYNMYRLGYATEVVNSVNQLDNLTRTSYKRLLVLVKSFNQLMIAKYEDNCATKQDQTPVKGSGSKLSELVNSVNTQQTIDRQLKNNYKQGSSFDASQKEEIEPLQTTAPDRVILEGAIMRKWGSQIITAPPQTQMTVALQERPIDQLLEAIDRSPIALKNPNSKGIIGFVLKVAAHPNWYTDKEQRSVGNDRAYDAEKELIALRDELTAAEARPEGEYEILPGRGMPKTQAGMKEWTVSSLKQQIENREGWLGSQKDK